MLILHDYITHIIQVFRAQHFDTSLEFQNQFLLKLDKKKTSSLNYVSGQTF